MSNFTPGPWSVSEGRSIEAQFEGETVQIASMARSSWSQPDGGKNVRLAAQTTHNARLIAAAPDLLEALQACVNACKVSGAPWRGAMRCPDPIKDGDAFANAELIIAKATS